MVKKENNKFVVRLAAKQTSLRRQTVSNSRQARQLAKQRKRLDFSFVGQTWRLIIATILFVLAIILFLGLTDLAGVAGEFLALILKNLFGWASWAMPIALLAYAGLILNYEKIKITENTENKKYPTFFARSLSLFLLVMILAGIFHIHFVNDKLALSEYRGGGYIGYGLSYLLVKTFGVWASWVIFTGALLIILIIIFNGLGGLVNRDERQLSLFKEVLGKLTPAFIKKEKLTSSLKQEQQLASEPEEEQTLAESIFRFKKKKIFSVADKKEFKSPEISFSSTKSYKKIDLPLALLEVDSTKPNAGDVNANKFIIQKTFENFNIPVEMGEIKIGPTVTQYTFKPADGIKLSQITSLHNDLALSLAAHPIRIEAPIPGQSLVGIEVPNQKVAIIRLKEILADDIFKKRKNNLSITLGRDVAGDVWLADLARMPHMLVAGATGSGKTIFLNTVIISLLYQNSPDDLRFILIDPKRVELTLYNDLPHLLTPVITNVQKTVNALRWATVEMDRRFDVMAEAKKRDIASYNQANPDKKLPYIVIIIDELADLMMTAAQEVEACIVRLAQMARATGIHLIMATQRPSVDIITGLIKANITARVAFSVASLMDSRTILDFSGAEKLLGRGDMLFISSEFSKPKRIQGVYVSDEEVKRIVEYLRNVAEPNYQEDITANQNAGEESKDYGGLQGDELLSQAREIVMQSGKASASLFQRRLRVGYARAARLLDLLEDEGTIGPSDGAKAREVYRQAGIVAAAADDLLAAGDQQQDDLLEQDESEDEEDLNNNEDENTAEDGENGKSEEVGDGDNNEDNDEEDKNN